MKPSEMIVFSFCLLLTALVVWHSPGNASAGPIFYPDEARTLATDITGSSNPPDALVAEIQLNLDAIRTLYPEMNHITIFPRGPWIVGDGNDIRLFGEIYRFMKKWGDCPAGCIYQENYHFQTDRGAIKLLSGNSPFSADINGDGIVNLLELNILGENWKTPDHATVFQGDLNGDGRVALLDLDILGREIQNQTAVPMPTSVVIMIIVVSLLLLKRRSSHAAGSF